MTLETHQPTEQPCTAPTPPMMMAALALAAAGFRAIPLHTPTDDGCTCAAGAECRSAGKHPRLNSWQRDATSDPAAIRGHWTRWPHANIGIAMGGAERFVALDFDGPTAYATLARLEAEHEPLPTTLTVRSGREDGGEHRIFRVPSGLNASRIKNATGTARSVHHGIDIRANGGQIVAPPSLHASGKRYTFVGPADAPIAELPAWLYELITAAREPEPEPYVAPTSSLTERIRRAEAYIAKVPGAIEGQHAGTAAFVVAMKVTRGFDLPVDVAVDLLLTGWAPRCQPPMKAARLRRKVEQADAEGTMVRGMLGERPPTAPPLPSDNVGASAAAPTPEEEQASRGAAPAAPVAAVAAGEIRSANDWQGSLIRDKKGKLVRCTANATTILQHDKHWAGILAWNALLQTIVTTRPPPWSHDERPADHAAGELRDEDAIRVQAWLHRRYRLHIGRESAWDALQVVARRTIIDPVADYLGGLKWDGVSRVDSWLTVYAGAAPSPYVSAVGRMFLVSAIARALQPGCKVDTMAVLEGPQGARKSTLARELFGVEWFCDTPLELESKDRFVALRGWWCMEMAELDSLRKSDATRIKSYLSSAVDSYRPPYGRGLVHAPRRCVFIGTTNAETYLRDETGNRRFWPVRCGTIDVEAIKRDRDQLWAEAHEMYQGGAEWWPDAELSRLCKAEASGRVQEDAWQSPISEYLSRVMLTASPHVSIGDVLRDVAKLEMGRWTQADQNRVARCLTVAGWQRVQRRIGPVDAKGRRRREWVYVPVQTCDDEDDTGDAVSPVSPVGSPD